jgi:hypothetical protein
VVKKYIISNYSTAKNMPKIAEVKLSSCGFEVADFFSLKSCGSASFKSQNCDCGL